MAQKKIQITLHILDRISNLLLGKYPEGWVGYLCDPGSTNDGQSVTLITEISNEDRCTVRCANGELERTFGRLLNTVYTAGTPFVTGERVRIDEPGANYHGLVGVIEGTVKKGMMINIKLPSGRIYNSYSRNFVRV
jgi:hypothetical protein